MKIGFFEKIFLIFISAIFDLVNFILGVTIILNTVINIFFGLFFIIWFKLKSKFSSGETEGDQEIAEDQEYRDLLKKQYDRLQAEYKKKLAAKKEPALEKGVGQEVVSEPKGKIVAQDLEKTGVRVAEQGAAQTGERLAEKVGAQVAIKETEEVVTRVSAMETLSIMERILGQTIVAKIIPILDILPLWTISTVLLLRRNSRDQKEREESLQSDLEQLEKEKIRYQQQIQLLSIELNNV